MLRSVDEIVRLLHELETVLGELSGAELRVLDTTLIHVHGHVVTEINSRNRGRFEDG